ncbi:MAG: sensor histidine kinase [Acidobacteria bacterium]|nr:sensor histidine kinase [Acidobacteriota bacterium]
MSSSEATELDLRGLVHDLNNVFQTLLDAADALVLGDDLAQVAGAIHRSVEHGQRLARSIVQASDESFAVAGAADLAIQFARDFVQSTHRPAVEFTTVIEEGLRLRGNRVAWERLLVNLLLNSSQAMPRGGAVEIAAFRDGRATLIRVSDNGPGIPAKILPLIFEPHFSTKPKNSGLGLHIVRTIAEHNGAAVAARNRDEGGAEFIITVPDAAILSSDD